MQTKHKKPMKRCNLSPWIHQLHHERPTVQLARTHETDIAIVGAGIAGVSTAYFLLTQTNKKVTILEGYKIAHGATGHNAGQVAPYFEKPFSEMVEEYGIKLAGQAQKDIIAARELLKKMHKTIRAKTPLVLFKGYAGCSSVEQILVHLHNKELRKKAGINMENIFIVNDKEVLSHIAHKYKPLYSTISKKKILSLLNTRHQHYIAALRTTKGTLNSAKFCEEATAYLQKKYPKRFNVFEHTHIHKIELYRNKAVLHASHPITCENVILCTNGFEHLKLVNKSGPDINKAYHQNIYGIVSHMGAYLDEGHERPNAISYFDDKEADENAAYFYLTRRKYEYEKGKHYDLVCVGGPEYKLREKARYNREKAFHPKAEHAIKNFLESYALKPDKPDYKFFWHGLMGYTKTRLRIVGKDPCNERLIYNLGCNGVGILSSVHGAKRIADIINNKKVPPSIFDPMNPACKTKIE